MQTRYPDYSIFHSLPGAGQLIGPALLSKFGDDRTRFLQPAALQALAGTGPVTDKSGKRKHIYLRHPCDPDFRYIAQQWARLSISFAHLFLFSPLDKTRPSGWLRPGVRCRGARFIARTIADC